MGQAQYPSIPNSPQQRAKESAKPSQIKVVLIGVAHLQNVVAGEICMPNIGAFGGLKRMRTEDFTQGIFTQKIETFVDEKRDNMELPTTSSLDVYSKHRGQIHIDSNAITICFPLGIREFFLLRRNSGVPVNHAGSLLKLQQWAPKNLSYSPMTLKMLAGFEAEL